jgi:chromosome segregation ATPase
MSVIDTVQLLEQRTQKAASLIAMLRKEKEKLQQQLSEAQGRPVVDPALQEKLDEALKQNADYQAQLASSNDLVEQLKAQLEEANKNLIDLQSKYDLVNMHNTELEDYVQKFETSNKIIEEGINKALENLNTVQGLDDVPLEDTIADDLATADDFTSGGALNNDQVDDKDLL